MGCVFPKPDAVDDDSGSNIFRVINIDQDGNNHLPGKLEITDTDLLLHQSKKQPIFWPIRTLRRYGYDDDVFSFEAGRRCPTGEGIFAFRCNEAEQLFRILQLNIQRSSNTAHSGHTSVNSIGNNSSEQRNARHESVGSQSSCPHTPVSPQLPFTSVYNFDSKNGVDSVLATPNSRSTSAPASPLYINVPDNVVEGERREESPPNSAYLYLTEKFDESRLPPLTLPSSNYEFNGDLHSNDNIQYITLELGSTSSSPLARTPVSEEDRSPGYTTIDFQKTWALVQSTKPNAENDRGCTRRTRHNSKLYDLQSSHR